MPKIYNYDYNESEIGSKIGTISDKDFTEESTKVIIKGSKWANKLKQNNYYYIEFSSDKDSIVAKCEEDYSFTDSVILYIC